MDRLCRCLGGLSLIVCALWLAGCGTDSGVNPMGAGSPPAPVNGNGFAFQSTSGPLLAALVLSPSNPRAAAFQPGIIPTTGLDAAPLVNMGTLTPQAVPGSALLLTVSAPQPVDRILVQAGGQSGYFTLDTSTAGTANSNGRTTDYHIVLPISPLVVPDSQGGFPITVATSQAGALSAVTQQEVMLNTTVRSDSPLQVTLSWNSPVDLDLHLKNPAGSEIGNDNPTDASGGMLDLSSNEVCQIDNLDQEHISFGAAAPPAGMYVVRPDLADACAQHGSFPYVVAINKRGQVQLFVGSFNDSEADGNDPSPTAPSRNHLISFSFP